MPIFKDNIPHKYFATDFMTVDPEYGTNEDLKNLIQEAHKRGIKVLIDFSINHANPDNIWFMESVERGKSNNTTFSSTERQLINFSFLQKTDKT